MFIGLQIAVIGGCSNKLLKVILHFIVSDIKYQEYIYIYIYI